MKNRYLIFSVLFWMVASVAMAVTLPSSSYSMYDAASSGNETYSLSIGTTINGTSMLYSSQNIDIAVCTIEGTPQDPNVCGECCFSKVLMIYDDEEAYNLCVNSCSNGVALGESPLGEALLLLPFIAIYAVRRRNRKDKE